MKDFAFRRTRNKDREDERVRRARGQSARMSGSGIESNPYPKGSAPAQHWQGGWGTEDERQKRGKFFYSDYDQRKNHDSDP